MGWRTKLKMYILKINKQHFCSNPSYSLFLAVCQNPSSVTSDGFSQVITQICMFLFCWFISSICTVGWWLAGVSGVSCLWSWASFCLHVQFQREHEERLTAESTCSVSWGSKSQQARQQHKGFFCGVEMRVTEHAHWQFVCFDLQEQGKNCVGP